MLWLRAQPCTCQWTEMNKTDFLHSWGSPHSVFWNHMTITQAGMDTSWKQARTQLEAERKGNQVEDHRGLPGGGGTAAGLWMSRAWNLCTRAHKLYGGRGLLSRFTGWPPGGLTNRRCLLSTEQKHQKSPTYWNRASWFLGHTLRAVISSTDIHSVE